MSAPATQATAVKDEDIMGDAQSIDIEVPGNTTRGRNTGNAAIKSESSAPEAAAAAEVDGGSSTPEGVSAAEIDVGLGVLSEEQTNAALDALQEASTIVIAAEAKEAEVEKAAKVAEHGKKRKADDVDDSQEKPASKRRTAPMRISWEDRMEMLRKYKGENGSLMIPIRYKKNPSLGKFVHNTREQFKLFHKKTPEGYKKKCSLTAERIKQLDDLGFLWTTERTKRQNEDWESRLTQLKEYKEKHGVSTGRIELAYRCCCCCFV
jgi:hypothetical protein